MNKWMNYLKKSVFILISIAVLAGCSNQSSTTSQKSPQEDKPEKITIKDANGKEVEVPTNIEKIADAWPAHNEVLSMLGAGNKIVSTVHTKESRPWLYKVTPQLNNAKTVFKANAEANIEEMLTTSPDIFFTSSTDKNAEKISSLGIPTVQLNFTDFAGLKNCFQLTGEILGKDAEQKAEKFNAYLDDKIKMVKDVTSQIPSDQKLKVLHFNNGKLILVDGSNTIIDAWVNAAGGVNAAADIDGNMKEVTMEQILQWNPDVIILGANAKNLKQTFEKDPDWPKVNAVKQGKVFQNPDGAFLWDRYGAEVALQIQWAAKLLNPDKFADLDMVKETKYFYKNFLNYELTDDEANRIISGNPPAN
ncbi:ABC transporter substrate-binding protein [Niallia sp. 01092]|uniref:ABC transporter substrate-binding protein n=1 Tax=unclassified Niallia TaxID=2837522 RepID=UPI003FD68228